MIGVRWFTIASLNSPMTALKGSVSLSAGSVDLQFGTGSNGFEVDHYLWIVLGVVGGGRHLEGTAATNPGESLGPHEPPHRAVGDFDVLAVQLIPDLLVAVATVEALVVDPLNLSFADLVATRPGAPWARLGAIVGVGGKLQDSADRFDPQTIPSGIDVAHYLLV